MAIQLRRSASDKKILTLNHEEQVVEYAMKVITLERNLYLEKQFGPAMMEARNT